MSYLRCSILFIVLALSSCKLPQKRVATGPNTPRPNAISIKDPKPYQVVRSSGPELLDYDEISQLSSNPVPTGALKQKFDTLLSTPFVNNEAYFSRGLPRPQVDDQLGPSIRVSTWNVEKSVRIPEVAAVIQSEQAFLEGMRPGFLGSPEAKAEALRQRDLLANTDILLLQEQDIGHCRSGYLFAAKYLAEQLGMNFAYAPQQLEVDPVYLGLDHIMLENGDVDQEACKVFEGAEASYRGVFGVSVLSRYPIKRAQIFQLETQVYDWYAEEAKKGDFLEKGRKSASNAAFRFQPVRELKVGGRGFTRVDLHVPDLPEETLTIINVHLEIKTKPKNRAKQMEEILGYIEDIRNPVIMAGDFNSAPRDVSSTSYFRFFKNTTTDPTNLLAAGLAFADITGASQARTVINAYKNHRDPLAWNVPVLFPNKQAGLFRAVENFRFSDGGAFDFRGDAERSNPGCHGPLANSNQRHESKGFTFTFSVPRPIGVIGKQRLDWMFVKSFLNHPFEKDGPYRFAPHFGETLGLINVSSEDPFSDHHPLTVILPLTEPTGLLDQE